MERKREKTIRTIGIKVAQVLVAMVIMVTAGIGLSGTVANAVSQNGCIVLERYNDEGEDASYEIGNNEIVMEDEEICIYKDGELIEEIEFTYYDCKVWIIDDVLYYSKNLEVYSYDFHTESIKEIMTIEPVGNLEDDQEWEHIGEVFLYHQSWLYLSIYNDFDLAEKFIRINLDNKMQETIIEYGFYREFIGVYNNYLYLGRYDAAV